ncbi:MAG: cytochrome c oxidase assembly protein [Acidimicrobiia bacterium]|nr:cytochrome c oxidase assembly protein [Acidimicrobiia bacterium]
MLAQAITQQASSMEEVLAWHPHFDVWAVLAVLGFGYWYSIKRIAPRVLGPEEAPVTRPQVASFVAGLVVLWVVSDWPIHDIAEDSLFMFHMFEHMVLGLVIPPLLLLGTPRWMARRLLRRSRVLTVVRQLARPVPAFFIFSALLIGIHWPEVVDLMVRNSLAHFAIHTLLFAAAINAWLPVFSPLPEIPRLAAPLRMLYLFLHSLGPTIPASFLTFGKEPIYAWYRTTPKPWAMDAITDQTLAGLVMKLGGGVVLWTIIAILWFRWYAEEQDWERLEAELRRTRS